MVAKWSRRVSAVVLWAAVLGLGTGCSERAQVERHRARAQQALERRELAEATRALEAAHRAAKTDQRVRGELAATLAELLLHQDRLVDAEPFAREGVALAEKDLGSYELETGRRHLLLGQILLRQEQLEPAAAALGKALKVFDKAMAASGSPRDVLFTLALFSSLRARQGRFEEAEKLARQGTEIRTSDADAKSGLWGTLADVYRDWEKLPEAIAASREAVRVVGEKPGLDQAGVLNNLAWMLAMAGEGAEAEKTARRAVQLTEEHGGNYVQLSGHLDTLAYALLVNGKLTEAEAIARKAIAQGEKGKLPGHTQAYEHGTLARILAAQGRTADAEAEFVAAEKLAEKAPPSLELARLIEAHVKLLREAGREADAEPLSQRALALRRPGGLVAEKAPPPAEVAAP